MSEKFKPAEARENYTTLAEVHEETQAMTPMELAEYEKNSELWTLTIESLGQAALSGVGIKMGVESQGTAA